MLRQKKYPFWRLDTFFLKKIYRCIYYIKDGGWHFTNIKSPETLKKNF